MIDDLGTDCTKIESYLGNLSSCGWQGRMVVAPQTSCSLLYNRG